MVQEKENEELRDVLVKKHEFFLIFKDKIVAQEKENEELRKLVGKMRGKLVDYKDTMAEARATMAGFRLTTAAEQAAIPVMAEVADAAVVVEGTPVIEG